MKTARRLSHRQKDEISNQATTPAKKDWHVNLE
jgi:hypothetical protein